MKVRDAIRLVEHDGWFLVEMRGSHRQYKHPSKLGRVTIAGKPSCIRNVEQYFEASRSQAAALMRYAIVIEKSDGNYSAYVPDLPGCVATGNTIECVER